MTVEIRTKALAKIATLAELVKSCIKAHMNCLAAHGVYFTRSYCAFPLCSPSRSSLHTGRTPRENRVDRNSVQIDPATFGPGISRRWLRHCLRWQMAPATPLPTLREIGQEDQTLIVFTIDHGEGLGAHCRSS